MIMLHVEADCVVFCFFVCVQAFKPLVGKSLLSSVTAVEFLLDRQLDFLSDHPAYQPYQVIITLTHTDILKDAQAW